FVDVDRRASPVGARATLHPRLVTPGVAVEVVDYRSRLRAQLHAESERIGLHQQIAALRADLVLVGGAHAGAWHEQLPCARTAARLHGVLAPVPEIDVADH